MLTSYADILEEIKDNLHWLKDKPHPEDELDQFVESLVPIYDKDTWDEWVQIPEEFQDFWQNHGKLETHKIADLMRMDLYAYYEAEVNRAWRELTQEPDEGEEDA
jgi:hypothetical protein